MSLGHILYLFKLHLLSSYFLLINLIRPQAVGGETIDSLSLSYWAEQKSVIRRNVCVFGEIL